MTRALLQQALDAMQEIYFYILSSNNNLPYKKLQEGIEAITAALAQPEPIPVLAAPTEDDDRYETNLGQDRREGFVLALQGEDFKDFPDHEYATLFAHDYFIDGWKAAVAKYAAPPAPILVQPMQSAAVYVQSDHLLKAMQAPFLCRVEPTQRLPDFVPLYAAPPAPDADQLRIDLETVVRRHEILRKKIESIKAKREPDRLDAHRYRWLRTRLSAADFFYSEPPRCVLVFDWPENVADGENCDQNVDAALAAATGGQP
jgi:hypothetical protein